MTSSVRLIAGSVSCYLILQPAALLLLPDLCNSILLVAYNSRQLKDVMADPTTLPGVSRYETLTLLS